MPYLLLCLLSFFCYSVFADSPIVLNPQSPEILAKDCTGCHGPNGISQGTVIPNIAGASNQFLFDSMKKYQSGKYLSTIMKPIAKAYNDIELHKIADYFSALPEAKITQPVITKNIQQGALLHKKYCQKCHNTKGEVNDDEASKLAGQWSDYLRLSFQDIKAGKREIPRKMKKRLQRLLARQGDQAIEALLAYYAQVNPD